MSVDKYTVDKYTNNYVNEILNLYSKDKVVQIEDILYKLKQNGNINLINDIFNFNLNQNRYNSIDISQKYYNIFEKSIVQRNYVVAEIFLKYGANPFTQIKLSDRNYSIDYFISSIIRIAPIYHHGEYTIEKGNHMINILQEYRKKWKINMYLILRRSAGYNL